MEDLKYSLAESRARGTIRSVRELVKAIRGYVEHHNNTTEGFIWTKTADAILEKVARAKATLDKITH
ncbi:hypothetical protein [Botrimarina mediterranea]|uniref:Transposase n=1 Tax=Botrimarina mediterranea TaxID=2528022 RepID=A0A518K9R2_9BACT|nr:hypothetical protein [Botrimarina mediterranea]QDV74532.1 hypothetical protein Spa11_27360 [Botrimarina mediterranea]QDV79172.1 hypothetical protein K2D_27830 [Planctomycetes bacterium K2D]